MYQYVGTHLHGVLATNERDVVGEFVVAQDGKIGQEDIPVKQVVKQNPRSSILCLV